MCWRTRPSLKDVVGAGDREMNAAPRVSAAPLVGRGPVLTVLSSAGCLSGEAATSAGPVGGLCTTPRRCSVTAGASTAAAFCAVSLLRPPIHLLQAEAAGNRADTRGPSGFCLPVLLDGACAQPPSEDGDPDTQPCVPTAPPLH